MAKKIGVVLALDGEREFTQAARNAQKEANMFKAELKKLTAEFDGNANSIDFLRKKQENLAKQQDAYRKKVEAANAGLEKANMNHSRQCKRLSELETELTKAKSAFEELKRTQDQSSTEYRKQEKEVEKLTTAVEKQKLARDRESGSITDWKKQITDAETAQTKINIEIKKNARLMKEAGSATNGLAKSIDGYGNEVQQTVKITETLGQSIKEGLGEAIGGKGFELLEKGAEIVADTMIDASGASKQLAASTGLSEDAAKRYQKVMQGIKGDNFGENYKDIANVMGEVVQIMGQLDDSAMKETTESAITLRDTFDMDINETIRAVDVMMKTMGVDAAKAFDLITVGAQNGLNRSGELVDNLTEYSQIWGQAGFSAEEMFAILENGLDAGAYNLDKVNDYVKEFGNSLADGRVAKNIGSFSEGTKMLFESWKQGGASTSDVFYSVINDLSKMENQQKALTIASEVWSALGEDNAMQVLTALDDVNDKYKEVAGAAEKLKEIKYSDLESAIGGLGSALQEKFVTPIANIAIPAVTKLAEMATDLIKGPEKASSEWQEMADGLSQANSELAATVQNRDSIVADAEAEAAKLDHLGERLLALNEITGKTNGEKAEMRQVVNQLGQSIPELAAAYDEETGKINLTETAIRNYIAAEKESITTQATLAANQELINSLIAAQSEYDKTAEKMETLQDSATIYESQISALEKLEQEYTDGTISQKEYEDGLMQIAMSYEDMLASGEVSLSTLGRFLHENLQKTETELKGVTEEHNNLGETIKEGTEKINADNESAKKLTESLGEMGETAGEAGDSLETVGDAAEDVAEKISASAETQKAALQSVRDAYQETRASIEEDLKSKISITEMFDGGEDLTTEKMNEILDSNLEGIKNYQENLAKVREMTDENGKALFSPEVIDELEKGGTEYANILNHMVYTWEEQGEYGYEQIKSIAEKWGEGLDFSEQTAEAEAANQVALDAMLGKLGSSDADFSNLTKTIEEEWADLPVATVSALQETVSAVKEMGVQIPEGLAEGIASGEVEPEDAISQLNGSMQGMFDGLAEIARSQGIVIPQELSSGIQSGGQAAVDAYNALIALLMGQASQAEATGKEIGTSMAGGTQATIESGTAGVETAAASMASAGAQQAQSKQTEYQAAGSSAAQQYAQGILSAAGQSQSAAGSMASRVISTLRAHQGQGYSVGSAIAAGVASGISGGASAAIGAAASMASSALAAAKAALGIHSPSRRFRYEVGQNISQSTACGMKCMLSGNTWAGSTWDGVSKVNIRTAEQDKSGNVYYVNADFRAYSCIEDSIADRCAYLLGAKNGSKLRYDGIQGCKNCREQIELIKTGGYATDVAYVDKICNIIGRFDLAKYDQVSDKPQELPGNDLLCTLLKFQEQLQEDIASGRKWIYSNAGCSAKMSTALKKGNRKCNCALLIRWALRKLGLLNGDNWWGEQGGTIIWKGTSKEQMLKHFDLIRIAGKKTVNQAIKDGTLQPGDIVTYVNMGHTNAYAGNGKWYDSGHAYCKGTGEGAVFKSWYGDTVHGSQPIGYILRRKGTEQPEEKLHIVREGMYIKKANADRRCIEINNAGIDCIVKRVGDMWWTQCGAFKNLANAEKRVRQLKNAGFDGIIKS